MEQARAVWVEVGHNDDPHTAILGNALEKASQSLDAASRGADAHDWKSVLRRRGRDVICLNLRFYLRHAASARPSP